MKKLEKYFLWLSSGKVLKSLPLQKFLAEKTESIFDTDHNLPIIHIHILFTNDIKCFL
jgi:hypothetical protein